MAISQEDIKNYQKFDDPFTKQRILAEALTDRLRQRFPQRELKTRTEFWPADENFGRSYHSYVHEITGKLFGIIPRKRLVADFSGGGVADKVTVYDKGLREIIEEETTKLVQITGASITISYNALN